MAATDGGDRRRGGEV
jgi:hypothetical protein